VPAPLLTLPLRDLPWRRTRDPWAVLVSELMLQQTQVARVVPRWLAFLDRFPTPAACAAAPAGDVIDAWAGLGYNRRAVNLHRCAAAVVERHGGRLPDDLDGLLALPGVGPYTARAVLAFAFERDVCPLDVNTARPLARAFGVADQAGADALVPPGRGWQWGQALMDLGALVCTRRAPRCDDGCPLRPGCRWRQSGPATPDPAAPASRQSTFAGSDRQGRGRLVDALRLGPLAPAQLAAAAGWPADPARAARAADSLVADGLARRDPGGRLRLP
jgi:A/G-specific adenine glycosylase